MNRRGFLKASAAGAAGLLIRLSLPVSQLKADAPTSGKVTAWVYVAPDNTIALMVGKTEMGQGTATSMAQLLAEELECDWTKVRIDFPVPTPEYGFMGVVGSQSVRTGWTPLRKAGAQAREVLVQAAAEKWNVPLSQCKAENSTVVNTATGAKLTYGELAEAAGKLKPPASPAMKDPKQFKVVGKSVKRLDTANKITGKTTFGLDYHMPGMLYASIVRSPVFGGKLVTFDGAKAMAMPGVKDVVAVPNGVAVLADNTWTAMQAAKAVTVKWDDGPNAQFSSPEIRQLFADKMKQPGVIAKKSGEGEAALAGAAKKIEAVYEAPFLAHAPMEPLNCTVHVQKDRCDVWASNQMQSGIKADVAKALGLPAEQVFVHTLYMGGGFGRRANTGFAVEAAHVAKAAGVPVKVTWSRENDLQHGVYRPASMARFEAGLGADGWPVAVTSRVASPSIMHTASGAPPQNGVDRTSVEGIDDMRYAFPNFQVEYHWTEVGAPAWFWRAVGYTQNTFFSESFVDEMAIAGGKDPVEFRRKLLANSPRLLNVLNVAADKAGWGKPLPAGHARGLAVVNNVGSFTAQVAEVSLNKGVVKVHKVVCVTDCGYVVNPAIVEQQVRSGIVFGLSAALKGEITLDKGRVQQTNFHQYDMLRIDETPQVEVHIIPSTEAPGGMGEASVPPIAPAVGNALYALTKKRVRRLPIKPEGLA